MANVWDHWKARGELILLTWTSCLPNWPQVCWKCWEASQRMHWAFGKAFCISARCGQSSRNSWWLHPDVAFSWKTNSTSASFWIQQKFWVWCTSWWICWHISFYLGPNVLKAEPALYLPNTHKSTNKTHVCKPQISASYALSVSGNHPAPQCVSSLNNSS